MASTTSTREGLDFADLGPDELREFLYQMMLIRRFEDKAAEMYTKGKIRGFLHLYTGQEACAVGAIHALAEQDRIVTHYRDHGHAIARGLEAKRVMAELYGKVDGVSGGRGGSMHLYDTSKGFLGGYAIVAAHLPLAVGLGVASQMRDQESVTMCIFGDGAVGAGEFHESLNMASLWKTPVVWFCENNLFGMGVHVENSLATEIYQLAEAYNQPSVRIDGNDVVEVYREMKRALDHARSGNGPYFIEAMTYRYKGHSMADPELYREREEIRDYRERDCIDRFRDRLREAGIIDDGTVEEITERVEREVQEAADFAEQSPAPEMRTLFDHILLEDGNA